MRCVCDLFSGGIWVPCLSLGRPSCVCVFRGWVLLLRFWLLVRVFTVSVLLLCSPFSLASFFQEFRNFRESSDFLAWPASVSAPKKGPNPGEPSAASASGERNGCYISFVGRMGGGKLGSMVRFYG